MRLWSVVVLLSAASCMTFYKKSCSRLSSSGTCDICNTRRGYVNTLGGGCSLLNSLWCNVMNPQGACLSCRNGYYPLGGKCAVSNPVTNCISYGSENGNCIDCDKNFFLNVNGTCSVVPTPINNCALHRDTTTCKRCAKDYVVQNGGCVAAVPNCRVQNGLVCNACTPNTFPVAAPVVPTTVFTADFWAQDFNLNTRGWSSTMMNTSPQCQANRDPNCATASSPDVCTACKPGFYLSTQGACLAVTANKLDPNCLQYSTANTCSACGAGSYLVSGACVANPALQTVPRCVYYSAPGQCDRCMATFAFNGITCVPVNPSSVDSNCEVYDFGNRCRYCNLATSKKFALNGVCTDLAAAQSLPNCASHNSTGCAVCSPGYYLTNGTCAFVLNAPIKNCGVYADPATCTECISGYLLISNVCTNITDFYCAQPETTGKCTACINGYEPTSGTCVATPAIARCFAMSAPGICAMCNDNFMTPPDQKSCIPSAQATSACTEYVNSTTCKICTGNFFYDPVANTCNATTTTISNCYNYTSATTCNQCTGVAMASTTSCTGTIMTNCAVVGSDNTKCTYCATTYYRDSLTSACTATSGLSAPGPATATALMAATTGNCQYLTAVTATNTVTCDKCIAEYYVTSLGTCAPVAAKLANCGAHNGTSVNGILTTATCVRCAANYKPDTSPIGACSSATAITNCAIYTSTGTCKYCSAGYRPDATAANCVALKSITNCDIYTNTTSCARCTVGNIPSADTTTCVPATITAPVTGCSRYALISGTYSCTNCTAGYYFNAGTCVAMGTPLANCKYQSAPYACQVCNTGYYPKNGVCTAVTTTTTNCVEYKDAVTCNVCASDFYLDATATCVQLTGIAGCGNYTNPTTCSNCTSGFYLNNTSCVAASGIAGCNIYASASTCASCVATKAMNPAGTVCYDNCQTATATGCTSCAPNAYMNNGVCTPTAAIVGCLYYSSSSACSQCLPTYALSSDNTTCTLVREAANCAYLQAPTPTCSLCEIGYTLSNDQCIAPSIAPTEACRVQRDANTCDVCGIRYYNQGSIGTCMSVDVR